jgi:hypothetical protein
MKFSNTAWLVGSVLFGTAVMATDSRSQQEQQSYLCIGNDATGFSPDEKSKKWVVTRYNTRKYVIKAPYKGEGAPSGSLSAVLAVYEFGGDQVYPEAFCEKGFNDIGSLFCQGLGTDFKFNRATKRFIFSFPFGYIDPPKGFFEGAAPYFEIGTCSPV